MTLLNAISSDQPQPLRMFDRFVQALFAGVVLVQVLLGLHRAHMLGSSVTPAIAFAAVLLIVGVLWFLRRSGLRGAFLARPVALVFATIGGLSAISAFSAPRLGLLLRLSTPLLTLATAALLMLAEQSPRVHIVPIIAFVVGVIGVETALTRDAMWEVENSRLSTRDSRVLGRRHRTDAFVVPRPLIRNSTLIDCASAPARHAEFRQRAVPHRHRRSSQATSSHLLP